MENRKKISRCIILSILLFFMSTVSAQSAPILVILDKGYGYDKGFKNIIELVSQAKEPSTFYIFNGEHESLAQIDVDVLYDSTTLMKRAYSKKMSSLARNIKSINSLDNKARGLPSHLEFLARKNREIGKIPQADNDAIIYSSLDDINLDDSNERFMPIIAMGNNIPSNLMYNANKINVHLVLPKTDFNKIESDYSRKDFCDMWRFYLQKSGMHLASCQSEEITSRIGNNNSYDRILSEDELKSIEGIFNGFIRTKNEKYSNTSSRTNNIQYDSAANLPNYEIALTWEGQDTDMDLSIWSAEGKLHFASASNFGVFFKAGNSEKIVIKRRPVDAQLRIVHSNGTPPMNVILYYKNDKFENRYVLSGFFPQDAAWRSREKVLQIPLERIENSLAMEGWLKNKQPY